MQFRRSIKGIGKRELCGTNTQREQKELENNVQPLTQSLVPDTKSPFLLFGFFCLHVEYSLGPWVMLPVLELETFPFCSSSSPFSASSDLHLFIGRLLFN